MTNGIGRPQRATAHLEVTCEYLWRSIHDDTISGGDPGVSSVLKSTLVVKPESESPIPHPLSQHDPNPDS